MMKCILAWELGGFAGVLGRVNERLARNSLHQLENGGVVYT